MFRRGSCVLAQAVVVVPRAGSVRHRSVRAVLVQDFESLGFKGEEVRVQPGYMRNFLYPRNLAVYGTPENISKYRTAGAAAVDDDSGSDSAERRRLMKAMKKVAEKTTSIKRHSNDGKNLHGQVTALNVADAVRKQLHVTLQPDHVSLPDGLEEVRELGEFIATYTLTPDEFELLGLKDEAERQVPLTVHVVRR